MRVKGAKFQFHTHSWQKILHALPALPQSCLIISPSMASPELYIMIISDATLLGQPSKILHASCDQLLGYN